MTETMHAARRASNSSVLEHSVRVGLVAYGLVHLVIAWLAVQLATGDRSGAPDQHGALHELATQPLGAVTLWVAAFGLIALAIWQAADAVLGHRKFEGFTRTRKRLSSAGRAAVYAIIAVSAIKTATGGESGANEEKKLTARIMELPLGQWLVGLVGVVVLVVAAAHLMKAITHSFEEYLEPGTTSGPSGALVLHLAQVGYVAKGVAIGVVGALFVWAASTYDPRKAGGLDVALRSLLEQPYGPWLLAIVALGIGCFGLYCFAWARHADTTS